MTAVEPNWQMWAAFAIIAIAIVLYANGRVAMEAISLGVIAAFLLLFHFAPIIGESGRPMLDARRLLAGFADPALVAVLCLMMVGQGLIRTGALESPVQFFAEKGRAMPRGTIMLALLAVSALSAFLNNTPIVVMFIPVIAALADRFRRSASDLMMPLSFAAILGGMTTLIGSSTNLLAAGAYADMGREPFGFFAFTPIGLVLASVGLVYALFAVPRLLHGRDDGEVEAADGAGRHYIAQLEVAASGKLVGQKAIAGMFPSLRGMTVRMVRRREQIELPPFEDVVLRPGDLVVVAATRNDLIKALTDTPDLITADFGEGAEDDPVLAEVMVPPASRMIGRNLQQIGFRYRTGCVVLGVQRRSRMIRASMDVIRLEAGDVLLVYGGRNDVDALRTSRDILLLEWSRYDVPAVWRAGRARLIFAAVVAAAATGTVPVVVAALTGALAMVLAGCLNVRQAARAVDRRIALLIASALAMGTTLEATGGAAFLAHGLISLFQGAGPAVTLSAFFLLVAMLTNILSNNATAVLFTPIAVNIAVELGVEPLSFVFAVIFAANCSFATPMGYQTNLLVMGPGHYKFADYMRAGLPLIGVIWIVFSFFAPWYFGY